MSVSTVRESHTTMLDARESHVRGGPTNVRVGKGKEVSWQKGQILIRLPADGLPRLGLAEGPQDQKAELNTANSMRGTVF